MSKYIEGDIHKVIKTFEENKRNYVGVDLKLNLNEKI